MLPTSKFQRTAVNEPKFADKAIVKLVEEMG